MKEERSLSAWVAAVVCCISVAESAFAGTIIGWGSMDVDSTQLETNDFVAIAAGEDHSLALRSDDSIVGWGDDSYGQATPPGGNDFVAIAACGDRSLALRADGSIVGWGRAGVPPAGNSFVAIAAGGYRSMAIKKEPCQYVLAGDLNDDCRVDFSDLAIIAANWLIDCDLDPVAPECIPK